jgi:hypothetical protein
MKGAEGYDGWLRTPRPTTGHRLSMQDHTQRAQTREGGWDMKRMDIASAKLSPPAAMGLPPDDGSYHRG